MNVLFTIASIYYLRVSLCQETTIEPINTTEKFINQTNFLNNSTDITNKITNKPFSNITDLNKNGKTLNTIKLLKVFNETNSSKDVDKLNYTVLYSYLVKTDVYLKDNEKIIKKNNSIYLNVQNKLIDVYMEAFARQDQFKSLKGNYTDLNIFITNVTITNATKTSIIFFYSVLHQNISYSVDDLINVMSMITIQEMVLMMKRLIKLKIEAVHTPDTTNYGVLAVIVIFSIIGVLILAWFICCISVRTIRCIKNQNLIINDYIRIKRIQVTFQILYERSRQSCAINTIPIEILPEMKGN
ncbi:hypothetical protein A3Q56_02358 [Intoshia linei]|uniref:SEA domain-containing protein n=1 Tax=Intoshia linei TaxID=1819745 RepID=A0A177B8F1_9BILA|nr:hypothetical protein A3Q56_02358 [Intoshia linei]